MNKKNKKKAFTLVELIAVIAIIGILAAVLVPKVTGYIAEAKKVEIIDEARKVVTAGESINIKLGTTKYSEESANTLTVSTLAAEAGGLIETSELTKVKELKVSDCYKIVNTEKYTFKVNKSDGAISITEIKAE